MFVPTLLTSLALARLGSAAYSLEDDYSGGNFFNMFNFYTGPDPTHGFVNYVDQGTAANSGLINTNGPVYMGVDHTNYAPNGRASVRLESKKSYNDGLIILDLAHMPGSICGTWPAFWMFGPNWPNNGEIDIIEGVHEESRNKMTLHTGPGCSITNTGGMLGSIDTPNCDVNAPGQGANVGCGIKDSDGASFGTPLNNAGGGVFATEITTDHIAIWRFHRNAVPGDVYGANPNPAGWGPPQALFKGACDIDRTFNSQNIIFDTTFCGDWAGAVWGSSSCAGRAGSCNDFVRDNAGAFRDSYWSINSLKVFRSNFNVADTASENNKADVEELVVSEPVASAEPTEAPSPAETATAQANAPLDSSFFPGHGQPGGIPAAPAKIARHRHARRHTMHCAKRQDRF